MKRLILAILLAVSLAIPAVATPTTTYKKDDNGAVAPPITGDGGSVWNYAAVDSSGFLSSKLEPQSRTTYAAGSAAFASVASATDVFEIYGSASKTIKVLRVELTGTQTTAGELVVNLIKRSTANTGGTSATLTDVPLDSTNAAGTAVAKTYTANPTTGTAVGNVATRHVFIPTALIAGDSAPITLFDVITYGQPVVLRGTAQGLVINFGGVTVTGGSFVATVYWTEE